jgi:hypothetical protein
MVIEVRYHREYKCALVSVLDIGTDLTYRLGR